jgi:hypothetical protein
VTREDAEEKVNHGTHGRDGTEQEGATNRINSHQFRSGESFGKGAAEDCGPGMRRSLSDLVRPRLDSGTFMSILTLTRVTILNSRSSRL